jgi:hypothetical protein
MSEKSSESGLKLTVTQNLGWILIAALVILGTLSQRCVEELLAGKEFTIPVVAGDAQRDTQIKDILYSLLSKTGADRAYVFVLHNGGYTAGRIPFKKMSCLSEVVKFGVSREIKNLGSIPMTSMPEMADRLVTTPDAANIVVADLADSTFKAHLEEQAIAVVQWHRVLVFDELWGFVGIDFLKAPDAATLEKNSPCVNLAAHNIQLELEKAR